MPGARSLLVRRYYGNPANSFWKAMASVDAGPSVPYGARCRRLAAKGIALWDVLAECVRTGSLDSAIRKPRPNDFGAFHRRHPELEIVLLNGAKARALFDRLVGPLPGVRSKTMPSTSPANTQAGKVHAWRRAIRAALR